ncbi:MAG: hypothetical protein CMF23_17430 [Ignavibacteriae bacterium]|nr:hypothetical protein [Ignavibacteriota bacterium]
MTENILKNINTFLQTNNTDYSLLINGLWGSGKTHFLKNKIISQIEALKVRPVYISLNGISEITQLEQNILFELLRLPGNNSIVSSLFNNLGLGLKKVTSFFSKGYFSLDITKLNLVSLFPLDKAVLIFDDLERISSKVGIDEILGYINKNFVEHKHVKVILIGDITNITDKEKYDSIKEKLIGREFNFYYNPHEITTLIKQKYLDQEKFLNFLKRNEESIAILIEGYSVYNLRSIFFFTEILLKIFSYIPAKDKIHEQVILFSFLLTLEFKKGSFHLDELKKRKDLIDLASNLMYYDIIKRNTSEDYIPSSYGELFAYNYLKNTRSYYKFFYSIYNLIVLGIFDEESTKKEFSENPHDTYNEALHKLNEFLLLSQKEIDDNCNKVFEGLKNGIFNVYTHQYVFDTLYPLVSKQIIPTTMPELKDKVFSSLDIAKKRNEFDQFHLDSGEMNFLLNDDSKEVFNHIKKLHIDYFNQQKNSLINTILAKLEKDKADYSKIIHSFLNVKFSTYFISATIITKLSNATNYSIIKFARFLAEKYRYDDYRTIADIPLLEEIKNYNDNVIVDTNTSPLLKEVCIDFNRMLNIALSELKKRVPQQITNN